MCVGGMAKQVSTINGMDYYNHIMVNPYDGKLTYYYSPVFGVAKQFASLTNY